MSNRWKGLVVLVGVLLYGWSLQPARGWTANAKESASEQQDWPAVIMKLREQLSATPNFVATRKQLAVAYNNYGVTLAGQGKLDEAIRQLEQAQQLDAANAQFRENLVRVYLQAAQVVYQQHRFEEMRQLIDRALALDARSAQAYLLLGELEYNSQRLPQAKAAWEQALKLDPSLKIAQERLQRVSKELPVESKFEKLSQAYFDIRYTENLERATGFDVRDVLLQARRSVGSDFAYWPQQKTIVLVYSAEQFRALRQETPDWVAGQYDGKIRVPLPGKGLDLQAVTRTLVHEYTHAVIHDLVHDRLPTWFNEGLAEYEGWKGSAPAWAVLRQNAKAGTVLPWKDLKDAFSTSLPANVVMLGYEESHSIIRYLVERYGFWRIRQVLKAVDAGTPLETVLETELHTKRTRLEAEWLKWVNESLLKGSR